LISQCQTSRLLWIRRLTFKGRGSCTIAIVRCRVSHHGCRVFPWWSSVEQFLVESVFSNLLSLLLAGELVRSSKGTGSNATIAGMPKRKVPSNRTSCIPSPQFQLDSAAPFFVRAPYPVYNFKLALSVGSPRNDNNNMHLGSHVVSNHHDAMMIQHPKLRRRTGRSSGGCC